MIFLLTACLYDRAQFLELSDHFNDHDGDGYSIIFGDCDDTTVDINPEIEEVCDGVDNDCDGMADEADAADVNIWYQDRDEDGYGNDAIFKLACAQPFMYVLMNGDCDDGHGGRYPDAPEQCEDEIDMNCDGISSYRDQDGDGYFCDDCDDQNVDIYPNAPEFCNQVDDDCNGEVDDDAEDKPFWYEDLDGDGYGNPEVSSQQCEAPAHYVENAQDCDDRTADAAPGLSEICLDGLDTNCDGTPGTCRAEGELTATAILEGGGGEGLGYSVAGLDDYNGDGFDDIAIGCPYGETGAHVVLGPFAGTLSIDRVSSVRLSGATQLGIAIEKAGNPNNDAYEDLMVGADGEDVRGEVFLISGMYGARYDVNDISYAHIVGSQANQYVGNWLQGDFDINNDGIDDVATASWFQTRESYSIFEGPLAGEYNFESDAQTQVRVENIGDISYTASIQDVDGNNMVDMVIGVSHHEVDGQNLGAVYLLQDIGSGIYDLANADRKWIGDGPEELGFSVDVGTDMDNDGTLDIWMSSYQGLSGRATGTVYALPYSAPNGVASQRSPFALLGESQGDAFVTLKTADFNFDGFGDVVVASAHDYNGLPGMIDVFYGPLLGTRSASAADAFIGGYSYIGQSIDIAGDIDGDGNIDVIAGAPSDAVTMIFSLPVW